MFNLIKKDFLTISRDRSELISLLAMPLILIAILGFALGGIMSGNGGGIDEIPVAIIVENNMEEDMGEFRQALTQEGYPEEVIEEIVTSSMEADPATIFLEVIESPGLEEVIDLKTDYNIDQAEEAILADEVAAIITIPEKFSYNTLMAIYLGEEPEATLELFVQDTTQIRASIMENIISSFTEQYNLELSILQATGGVEVEWESPDDFGQITYISTNRPVSSFQYYTMGMAVMFALYVASTISSNAYKEKTSHVFARLMLTGERPLRYLLSKGISATVLSLVQQAILFIVSTLLFQTFNDLSSESLIGMALVTVIFSLTIGSIATLLTSIALYFNNDAVSGIFSGFIVSGFAFIGGSMMPVEQFSPLLRAIGNWTPNGAMMTAYLQLLQGFDLSHALPMIYRVVIMMIIFIIAALAIFPRRRLT